MFLQLEFFYVISGPASLPVGFLDALRDQAQQQLDERAQGALSRILFNHTAATAATDNYKPTQAPPAGEGGGGDVGLEDVSENLLTVPTLRAQLELRLEHVGHFYVVRCREI